MTETEMEKWLQELVEKVRGIRRKKTQKVSQEKREKMWKERTCHEKRKARRKKIKRKED